MNFERDFEQNMNQLVHLLKKIIKNLPGQGQGGGFGQVPNHEAPKDGSVQVNLCFFNFIPMTPEDLDDLETAYEEALYQEDRKQEDVKAELSAEDIAFLKKHGITY